MINPESAIIVYVIGMVLGSFGNNIISAFITNSAIELRRSRCFCGEVELQPLELIPVISFFVLRGSCRYCKKRISFRYPLVELISGLIALLSVYFYGISFSAGVLFIQLILLLCMGIIDFNSYIIPNILVALFAAASAVQAVLLHQAMFLPAITAVFITSVLVLCNLYFQRKTGHKIIGEGDIKLLLVLNLFIPFPLGLLSLWLSAALALIVMVILRKYNKRFHAEKRIPFGFFLSFVYGLTLLCSNSLMFTIQKGLYDTF